MPDILDISHLRGTGKLPDEEELADAAPAAAPGSLRCSLVSHQWFVRQSIYLLLDKSMHLQFGICADRYVLVVTIKFL